jgi:hypothetical protein
MHGALVYLGDGLHDESVVGGVEVWSPHLGDNKLGVAVFEEGLMALEPLIIYSPSI